VAPLVYSLTLLCWAQFEEFKIHKYGSATTAAAAAVSPHNTSGASSGYSSSMISSPGTINSSANSSGLVRASLGVSTPAAYPVALWKRVASAEQPSYTGAAANAGQTCIDAGEHHRTAQHRVCKRGLVHRVRDMLALIAAAVQDITGYTPNTAIEMQRSQIEKLQRHIADLKAAELDLAAAEFEEEKRRTSDLKKHHEHEIQSLKTEISASTAEMEAYWQRKVEQMAVQINGLEQRCQQRDVVVSDQAELSNAFRDENKQLKLDLQHSQAACKKLNESTTKLESLLRQNTEQMNVLRISLADSEKVRGKQEDQARAEAAKQGQYLLATNESIEHLSAQLRESQQQLHEAKSKQDASAAALATLTKHSESLNDLLIAKSEEHATIEEKVALCIGAGNSVDDLIVKYQSGQSAADGHEQKLRSLNESIVALKTQADDEEVAAAETSRMIAELQDEKLSAEEQLRMSELRCVELEATAADSHEATAEVWGKAQKERKQLTQLQVVHEKAQAEMKTLVQTIESLEQQKRAMSTELEAMAARHATSQTNVATISAELSDTQAKNSELNLHIDAALDKIHICENKLCSLTRCQFDSATQAGDSLQSACARLLTATEQMFATFTTAVRPNSELVATNDRPTREHDISQGNSSAVWQERDRLAEQNAFLHMDVANLTTQLIQLLAATQRRDEEMMRMQAEVDRLQATLQETIVRHAASKGASVADGTFSVHSSQSISAELQLEQCSLAAAAEPCAVAPALPHKLRAKSSQIPDLAKALLVDEITHKYEKIVGQLQSAVSAAVEQHSTEAFANDVLQKQLQQLRAELSGMCHGFQAQLEAAEMTVTSREADNRTLKGRIAELQAQLEMIESEKSNLQKALGEAHAQASAEAEAARTHFQRTQTNLEQRLVSAEQSHATAEQYLKSQVEEIAETLSSTVAQRDAAFEQLRDEMVGKLTASEQKHQKFRRESMQAKQNADSQLVQAQQQLAASSAHACAAEREHAELTAELRQFIASVEATISRVDQEAANACSVLMQMIEGPTSQSWSAQLNRLHMRISEVINTVSTDPTHAVSTDADDSAVTAAAHTLKQIKVLFQKQNKENEELQLTLKQCTSKSTPSRGSARSSGRRGLSEASVNTIGTPNNSKVFDRTIASIQSKHDSMIQVQDQVAQQVMNLEQCICATASISTQNSIRATGETSGRTPRNKELDWWMQMSPASRDQLLCGAPSGQELRVVDVRAQWDNTVKLQPCPQTPALDEKIASATQVVISGSTTSSGATIGMQLQIDLLMKELQGVRTENEELRREQHKTPSAAHRTVDVSSTRSRCQSAQAISADGHLHLGTPNWSALTPLPGESDDLLPTLADSVNRELEALHRHAVTINHSEQQQCSSSSPRRMLSGLQEMVLEHISALSMCLADTIRKCNMVGSPPGTSTADHIAGLKKEAEKISAAFQRSLGSSGAGWLHPVANFIEEPPAQTACPWAHVGGRDIGVDPQRSLEFTGENVLSDSHYLPTRSEFDLLPGVSESSQVGLLTESRQHLLAIHRGLRAGFCWTCPIRIAHRRWLAAGHQRGKMFCLTHLPKQRTARSTAVLIARCNTLCRTELQKIWPNCLQQ
jgi:chromosome segregation ATPase